jgi:Protein of unknown function DUF262
MIDRSSEWTNPSDYDERLRMQNYESRTYSVNDFLEWEKNDQLELNPVFQRRRVWTEKAKSYLMDTILRGKPIPKIFIRQRINVSKKTTIRDVVDGQQRLRTILSFMKDGFAVSKQMNEDYGGLLFSQLPSQVQAQLLGYALSVDLLIDLPDPEVLDIFSRLNSYAVILNEQEKINANHFGPFKLLADRIGHKYNEYWITQGILTPKNIMRMLETNLVADLLIAMREGIKSKKQIRKYYDLYEQAFSKSDVASLEERFDKVTTKIGQLYPDGLSNTEFSRPFLFYSLFTAVAHCLYGLPRLSVARRSLGSTPAVQKARNGLDRVDTLFEIKVEDIGALSKDERQLLQDSRRATTDESVRERRTKFLLKRMA